MTTTPKYIIWQFRDSFQVWDPDKTAPIASFSNKLGAEQYIAFLRSGGKVLGSKAHLTSRIDTMQAVVDTAVSRHNAFSDEVCRIAMWLERAVEGRNIDPVRDAAPDLLAALEKIDSYLVNGPRQLDDSGMERFVADVRGIARAAIAKAKGE